LKGIIAGQGRYSRMIDCRAGRYCGVLLLGIIEVLLRYCGALLRDDIAGHYCRALLQGNIAGQYCRALLQGIIEGHY
jgi:hypothetical protein